MCVTKAIKESWKVKGDSSKFGSIQELPSEEAVVLSIVLSIPPYIIFRSVLCSRKT